MILVRSSRSFFVQQLKRYGWVFVFSLYLCFTYIIEFAMAQKGQYIFNGDERLGPQNATMFYITLLLALICALQGFSMVFSEKKTGFYFSLPIGRGYLFFTKYMCGLLTGLVPCIFSRIICYFLRDSNVEEPLYLLASGIAVNTLGFLFIYHICIVIILLTGRLLAAALLSAAVIFYGQVLTGLIIERYSQVFFHTYYYMDGVENLGLYLTPTRLYETMAGIRDYMPFEEWVFETKESYVTVMAILLLLALAFAVLLFGIRPAEGAGKTLAFAKSKAAIKLIVAVPLALLCGYGFMRLSLDGQSLPLMLLGIFVGAILSNTALEVLYYMDVRKIFHKKWHILVSGMIACFIAGSFYFDVWGYDSFMPDEEEVESVAVVLAEKDESFEEVSEQLEKMELAGKDKENVFGWLPNLSPKGDAAVAVGFHMKSGQTVYRRYFIENKEQMEKFAPVYESMDYKRISIPLALEKKADQQRFSWTNGAQSYRLAYSEQDTQKLLDNYLLDLKEQTLSGAMNELPVSMIRLENWSGSSGRNGYVYPSFHRTIGFLKEKGIPADSALASYEITRIEIIKETRDVLGKSRKTDIITEAERINILKRGLVFEPLAVNPLFAPVTQESILVEYRLPDNEEFGVAECKRMQ